MPRGHCKVTTIKVGQSESEGGFTSIANNKNDKNNNRH